MATPLSQVFDDRATNVRGKVIGIYLVLIVANVAVWAWAFTMFRAHPVQTGTALLAYSLGLRHAVDADHIAAIDNVTRKLMQEGKRPVSVGFFFSLGHSTIVVLASVAIALTATAFDGRMEALKAVGGIVGTIVSATFLLGIAIINLFVLATIYRTFRHVAAGGTCHEDDLGLFSTEGGVLARLFRPMFRLIARSWHMYPLGVLFGLGFDTATEVGLLGISAASASHGLPIWSILVFPALFTAGMSLVDTTDGILMLGAYGWAYVKPARKLYYNMAITLVSVVIALVVGSLEVLNLIGDRLRLTGTFWEAMAGINDNFGIVGYGIVGVFVGAWLMSYLVYRAKGYDALDIAAVKRPAIRTVS